MPRDVRPPIALGIVAAAFALPFALQIAVAPSGGDQRASAAREPSGDSLEGVPMRLAAVPQPKPALRTRPVAAAARERSRPHRRVARRPAPARAAAPATAPKPATAQVPRSTPDRAAAPPAQAPAPTPRWTPDRASPPAPRPPAPATPKPAPKAPAQSFDDSGDSPGQSGPGGDDSSGDFDSSGAR